MSTSIAKWGNGQGIRIPKGILERLQWKNNERVELIVEEDELKIKPVRRKRKTIQELFDGYGEEYACQEIDWGEPVGKEVW